MFVLKDPHSKCPITLMDPLALPYNDANYCNKVGFGVILYQFLFPILVSI